MPPANLEQIEERVHGLVRRGFDARRADLDALGLQVELDPVARRGEGTQYASSIEATLRWPDADVQDVIFFYVAEQGRLVLDVETIESWIRDTIDASIAEARASEERTSAD
jgi:hypothetical protein